MPKLVVKNKAEILQELTWKNSKSGYRIGSNKANDLILEDKQVSESHARIERRMNRFYIYDLQSAFGTRLNGKRVEEYAELGHGDDLQIGKYTISFDNPLENVELDLIANHASGSTNLQSVESDGDTVKKVMIPKQGSDLEAFEAAFRKESQTQHPEKTTSSSMTPYYLLAIYGPYAGRRYQVRYGETKIGRDEDLNDIIICKTKEDKADQSISRRHATIVYKEGSFYVTDKRSKTRTYVNNEVVPEDGKIDLITDDEIEIVSDQQSTIFRFVEQDNKDFRPPRKAGVWWVRHRSKFAAGLATLAVILGAFLTTNGFLERSMLIQRPDPLNLELSYWMADKSMATQNLDLASLGLEKPFELVPTIADFNGDGYIDIVTANIANKPILIDGQTQGTKWIFDTIPVAANSAFVSADINQDGISDIIYCSADGRVVAIDGVYGAEIWSSPFFNKELNSPPVIDDFDGDKLADIAVVDVLGNIHIGHNKIVAMEWASLNTGIAIQAPLSCADIDRDGDLEIISGSDRGIVLIIDGATRNIIGTIDINAELNRAMGTVYEDNQIRHPVGIAELTGDNHLDFVISTVRGRIIVINGTTKQRQWHDILSTELSLNSDYSFPFALSDFDGDGLTDFVIGSEDGSIRAYSGKGKEHQPKLIWKLEAENSQQIHQGIVLGDINKDQIADVAYVDVSGALRILNGKNGESLIGKDQTTSAQTSMPLLADLHKDGKLDIFMVTKTAGIIQYKSNSRISNASVLWGQKYGQSQNTLTQTFILPDPIMANVTTVVGLIMFLAGAVTIFFVLRKKSSTSAKSQLAKSRLQITKV